MNVPKISAPLLWFFRRTVRRYFRRQFHGVRISGAERLVGDGGPLIIYANHSSWWDPMVLMLLGKRFFPRLKHYAPMDAEALDRYAIFKRLGIFPVVMKTSRGAVQFLKMGEAILASGGVLWVTPQGRFVDGRERPLVFKPGLAALAQRVAERSGSCTVLPLAIEYAFWDERVPETLLRIGQPVQVTAMDTEDVQERLVAALEIAMDELRALSQLRDAGRFTTLIGGTVGTGGFYALGERIRAVIRRKPYRAEHTATVETNSVGE
jgi:1-acyl-sn-glycerol-3-phosphate acyltransferase